MRAAPEEVTRQFDPVEEARDALLDLATREAAEILQRLGHLRGQPPVGIERGKGVLKHHLHVAPRPAQPLGAEGADLVCPQSDLAAGRLDQAQDRATAGRFATAAFAHQREGLAGLQIEGDILDRMNIGDRPAQNPALDRKTRRQLLHRQERRAHARRRFRRFGARGHRCHRRRMIVMQPGEALRHLGAGHRPQTRHRRQQPAGVILLRRLEDLGHRAGLDDVSAIHHHHPVGHLRHDGYVMREEQHGHPVFALEPVDQAEDFGLDRDVERGGRFVRDQQARLAGHRHRDDDALAHPPRQLVRILREAALGLGDTDLPQKLERARAGLCGGQAAVLTQTIGQLMSDREDRIERGHRLLKDHSDLIAAKGTHRGVIRLRDIHDRSVGARKPQGAPGDPAASEFHQPHQRQRGHRLARATLPDDADGFARTDGKADVAHADDGLALALEFDAQMLDRDDGGDLRHACFLGSRMSRNVSPSMFSPSTVSATAAPGTSPVHGPRSR
ncbi:hypothetical protein SDC9_55087 [bioreactor metagenome]|uniref:Uncharacterized protein n=1 Tax=bioreactor metagenome TaxID=1076179 RepID=A0A644WYV1_9ZZZZ